MKKQKKIKEKETYSITLEKTNQMLNHISVYTKFYNSIIKKNKKQIYRYSNEITVTLYSNITYHGRCTYCTLSKYLYQVKRQNTILLSYIQLDMVLVIGILV
uniref:Uncharacterized protein n=1 Tax=Schizaphis graminum TaxID=13262 RepID=A0A2S2NTG8_SCHGA